MGFVALGVGRAAVVPCLRIEPVFVMSASHHERLFGVKPFFERVFAFRWWER
jgi:hypothetical protein